MPSVRLFFASCLLLFAFAGQCEPVRVVFINPGHQDVNPTGPFWSHVSEFMHASADQLNMDLMVFYAERDHLLMKRLILQSIRLAPDYLILVNEKGAAESFLPLLDKTEINVVFLLNPPTNTEQAKNRQSWLANVVPDNHYAGYLLARTLHQKAKSLHPPPYTLLAIGGDLGTQASRDRQAGLDNYLQQHSNELRLINQFNANWSQEQAFERSQAYFSRLEHIDIVWAANDPMAKGAKRAKQIQSNNPYPTVFGGVNWDEETRFSPSTPDLSVGGHFTAGAFALILIYDHFHNQRALKQDINLSVFSVNNSAEAKVLTYLLQQKQLHKIDFKKFTRKDNPPGWKMNLKTLSNATSIK